MVFPLIINTFFKCMMLPVGEREAWVSGGLLSAANRMTSSTKTYPSCHSSIIIIPCGPKTVYWLQVSPFYLLGKENGMQMVSGCAEATSKEKQQHRAHLGHCGDFIDCTMILFTYAS
jgi:hypothetical protein